MGRGSRYRLGLVTMPGARTVRIADVTALVVAALLPSLSAVLTFLEQGVTNPVLSGDAASLELGVRQAVRLAPLVGPSSGFGPNHPGPLYFYLVAPSYLLFQQRSSAL